MAQLMTKINPKNAVAKPHPCPRPNHHTPPRDKKEPHNSGQKILQTANIAQITGGTSSRTARQTTSCTPSATTTRSGRGGGRSGFARKSR